MIIPDITTMIQHLSRLERTPEDYRPKRCPHCGKSGLYCHGAYIRQSNRRGVEVETDEPIAIPRFLCPDCGKTCSTLPEAIPPSAPLFMGVATVDFNATAQWCFTQYRSQTTPAQS